jgi:hypothetical protein
MAGVGIVRRDDPLVLPGRELDGIDGTTVGRIDSSVVAVLVRFRTEREFAASAGTSAAGELSAAGTAVDGWPASVGMGTAPSGGETWAGPAVDAPGTGVAGAGV